MTLLLLHSEFSYIGGKFEFLFYWCSRNSVSPNARTEVCRLITSDSEAVVLAVVDLVVCVVKGNFSVVEEAPPETGSTTLLMVGCGTAAGCCGGGWPATGGGSRGWSPYWGAN